VVDVAGVPVAAPLDAWSLDGPALGGALPVAGADGKSAEEEAPGVPVITP
jgi:hypothetical protein